MGLEWNDWGDVCLTDKRSNITSVLTYKSLPEGHSGLAAINFKTNSDSVEQTRYELACMQALAEDKEEKIDNDLSQLPDSEYKSLLSQFPELLKLHFEEEYTKNGVQHRILTGDAKPTKAKRRNMLPGSPREV